LAGDLRATHPHFVYTAHGEPQLLHNSARLARGSGPKGEAPAYAGVDFIIAPDGKIAALYVYLDLSPTVAILTAPKKRWVTSGTSQRRSAVPILNLHLLCCHFVGKLLPIFGQINPNSLIGYTRRKQRLTLRTRLFLQAHVPGGNRTHISIFTV
jgi:hypothetical protein